MNYFPHNLPILLTWTRLVLSPCLMPPLLVASAQTQNASFDVWVAGLFVMLGLTDFLDGYLARQHHQETIVGALLDPIADKILVFSTAITLAYVHKIPLYWPIIVMCRDLFVMGLREIALKHQFLVAVSTTAKIKTVLQIIFLAIAIAPGANTFHLWQILYTMLLIISLVITVISAMQYYVHFMNGYARARKK